MSWAKKKVLIASILLFLSIVGCETTKYTSRFIPADALQAISNDPSRSIPFRAGDEVDITVKSKTKISTRYVKTFKAIVKDANKQRIKGEVIATLDNPDQNSENVIGEIVDIELEDIETIRVWSKRTRIDEDTLNSIILFPLPGS